MLRPSADVTSRPNQASLLGLKKKKIYFCDEASVLPIQGAAEPGGGAGGARAPPQKKKFQHPKSALFSK